MYLLRFSLKYPLFINPLLTFYLHLLLLLLNFTCSYLAIGLIKLLSLTSLSLAQKVGRGLGWLLLQRRTRAREVARLNLSLCYPHLSEAEREDLLAETLAEKQKPEDILSKADLETLHSIYGTSGQMRKWT